MCSLCRASATRVLETTALPADDARRAVQEACAGVLREAPCDVVTVQAWRVLRALLVDKLQHLPAEDVGARLLGQGVAADVAESISHYVTGESPGRVAGRTIVGVVGGVRARAIGHWLQLT